jgi:hypothetical protein
MKKKTPSAMENFAAEAVHILGLPVAHRVNKLGGYGPASEVIYEGHPSGCPSVLVDSRDGATATFMSSGSVGFTVKLPDFPEIKVLASHFDPVEKCENGAPSSNVWLALQSGKKRYVASLMNPNNHANCPAQKIRVVKLGDPSRAMWYCAWFQPEAGVRVATAVKLSLRLSSKGPVLLREVLVQNLGRKPVTGHLWTHYFLPGTQRFVYNKSAWYDCGCPVSLADTVMTARVPYSDLIQIKRQHSDVSGLKPLDATCDYATFVGDTAALSLLPAAVLQGKTLKGGAGRRINRFSTAAVSASQFGLRLAGGATASLRQSLLFVADRATCDTFRELAGYKEPSYKAMTASFQRACRTLLRQTDVGAEIDAAVASAAKPWPAFEVQFPAERAVSEYANSVWTGVKELYENCRAHGAKLADGIELGTRDRGQDMWPKIKEDPGRVRADLVHVMSFMYVTHEGAFPTDRPLTLREKLHGMFPRQYPSHWNNRALEIRNDNRPYTDSPLWLIDSLAMYIRETGDTSILLETVKTISLTTPDTPETSGIVGNDKTFRIAEVMREVFACFERHAGDSPYGIAQILYGDWCDPIDMYGTSEVGNAKTRGQGRGVQVRLSGHLFLALVEAIDIFETPRVAAALKAAGIEVNVARLQAFASRLRQNLVKVAWEDDPAKPNFMAAFLNCIHERKLDGSVPDYAKGDIGYTLGSLKGRDFDGLNRRELGGQACAIEMLVTQRPYLAPIPEADAMLAKVLRTVDRLFYDDKLGLVMFTRPIANNADAIARCGRMGVLPAGTAENGEYHHCQVMMHRFRLSVPGQADIVWRQFKPMMSALRDDSIAGPFETPCTSYVSDKDDPHFGKGMYFGLSGSVDWIVEVFHKVTGVSFALHDPSQPAIRVAPNLPAALDHQLTFRRIVHCATGAGTYRQVPLQIEITREGEGKKPLGTAVTLNGQPVANAEVASLDGLDKVELKITYKFGR